MPIKRFDYDFKRVFKREDVYAKIRKRVRIGEVEYESVNAAARALRIYPSSLSKILKEKGKLTDGRIAVYIK